MVRAAIPVALAAVLLGACAGAPARQRETVLQFVDIRNASGEPVEVTARVGASAEQRLGLLGPAEGHRFEIPTGAATTGDLFLRARNRDTGREAVRTLQVTPGQTLSWEIRF